MGKRTGVVILYDDVFQGFVMRPKWVVMRTFTHVWSQVRL